MAKATQPAEGWQLESNSAEAYERYLVPVMMAQWAERLVELAAPRPGERVLDVGCGTGIVARTAAPRVGPGGSVTGLDLNAGMLAVARATAAAVRPSIDWREGNAAALPFEDASSDVVFSQQMLQFASDPLAVLREMRRVLQPGGRAALGICRAIEHSPAYIAMAEALNRHVGTESAAMMRSPFPSWTTAHWRELVRAAGFADVRVRIDVTLVRYPSAEEFLRREAASSPLSGAVAALAVQARRALVQELETALEPRRDDEGLALPIETHLTLARA